MTITGSATGSAPSFDASAAPWPLYAEAVVELILDGQHLVLTPSEGTEPGPEVAAFAAFVPPVWVLTAGDPYPLELEPSENAARMERLCVELDAHGLQHDPALGRSADGTASERSRAVRGADRSTVLGIAARYDQLAVYEIADRIACVDVASASIVTSRAYRLRSAPAGSDALLGPTGWRG